LVFPEEEERERRPISLSEKFLGWGGGVLGGEGKGRCYLPAREEGKKKGKVSTIAEGGNFIVALQSFG